MAEAVFQHMVDEAGLSHAIEVDSAGTGSWHIGERAHRGTREVLARHNIPYDGRARQVERDDFRRFDYILAMDNENFDDLERMMPAGSDAKLARFLDFAPQAPVREVPDPWYDGRFDEVYALVRQGGDLDLLKTLIVNEFPVLIEEGYDPPGRNLGWMGHYETVVAYDDNTQTIWVYDSYLGIGSGYGRTYSYDEFDNWWRHFNRTFLVFFPLERTEELRALLGPYEDVSWAANTALNKALQEAAADQSDGWAWFNAGVSAAKLGNYYDAASYFDLAFAQGLPFRVTWYHFAPYEAYYNVGRYQDVIDLANNTEATTLYVEETYYWRGMAYAAQGLTGDAQTQFELALDYNRNFTAAADALARVEAGQAVMPSMAH
jgi:protein-tyrosine phosphatase